VELAEQTQLIREFMLSIAPEVTRHRLSLIRRQLSASIAYDDEELANIRLDAAAQVADTTLQWSMHLAGAFGNFLDETQRTPAKDPFKALQHETAPAGSGL
jgi:hypothetical protein